MGEISIEKILIGILYDSLNEVENNPILAQQISSQNLPLVYRLAKKHHLSHIVFDFVYKNKIVAEPTLQEQMQREQFTSVYKSERINYAINQICELFEENKIIHILLKGAVIKKYYPYESMRLSGDIDILVQPSDIDNAVKVLQTAGYSFIKKEYHDVWMQSPDKINLELHFNVLENNPKLDEVLKDVWQYIKQANGKQYEFTQEFFVFYMYAHIAYHFIRGGCGIRSLMDIWIMEHKMQLTPICAKELLNKGEIYTFASEMNKIANKCFTDKNQDDFSDLVLKYICRGGVYGSLNNNVSVAKSQETNSFVYALKRFFPPYNSMKTMYPILKNLPFLLPFCWVIRLVNVIRRGQYGRAKLELLRANKVNKNTIDEIKKIRSRLKL